MKTIKGAQRILDYRVFRHNFSRFPEYKNMFQTKYEEYRIILTEIPNPNRMAGHGRYFQSQFKKLDNWSGNYQRLWDEYFAINNDTEERKA